MPHTRRLVTGVAFVAAAGLLLNSPSATYGRPAVDGHSGSAGTSSSSAAPAYQAAEPRPEPRPASRKPLQGKTIAIDPGHQLGNSRHPRQINRPVNAGGFRKACNTTGTSTNGGYPEATFGWQVARTLKRQLVARGATVRMTRTSNSVDRWGPCIDERGRFGNRVHADAVVSLHGDGADPSSRGFFVIRPGSRPGWTGDIRRPSQTLAGMVKRGLMRAGATVSTSYRGGLDVRTDLGTLNWSDVPIVMVELGNMRNVVDARHMTTPRYRQHVYARGLRLGITAFVLR